MQGVGCCGREAAARVGETEQDVRHRTTHALPCVKDLEQTFDFRQPGHLDGITTGDDDDEVALHGCDSFDELFVSRENEKVRPVTIFAILTHWSVQEQHDRVGSRRLDHGILQRPFVASPVGRRPRGIGDGQQVTGNLDHLV